MKISNFKWMGDKFQFCQVELDNGEKYFGGPYFSGGQDWFKLPELNKVTTGHVADKLQVRVKEELARVAYPTLIRAAEEQAKEQEQAQQQATSTQATPIRQKPANKAPAKRKAAVAPC